MTMARYRKGPRGIRRAKKAVGFASAHAKAAIVVAGIIVLNVKSMVDIYCDRDDNDLHRQTRTGGIGWVSERN